MDKLMCKWISCNKGNPEDFKELETEIIKISDIPHSFADIFIICFNPNFTTKTIFIQVIRRYLNNKWVWLDEINNKVISDNDVISWYMLPYPEFY